MDVLNQSGLSPQGKQITGERAGHIVQGDEPNLAPGAMRELIAQSRTGKPSTSVVARQ